MKVISLGPIANPPSPEQGRAVEVLAETIRNNLDTQFRVEKFPGEFHEQPTAVCLHAWLSSLIDEHEHRLTVQRYPDPCNIPFFIVWASRLGPGRPEIP